MAAQRLGIPDRQCRRLLSRYNQSGPLSMPNLNVCLNPGPWMKRRHDRSFVRRLKPALIFLIPRISTRAVVQKKLQEKR
ncbi:hypothetical protein AAHW09_13200 [Klebsiella pneumoniae]